jgi:hypothetical protein
MNCHSARSNELGARYAGANLLLLHHQLQAPGDPEK